MAAVDLRTGLERHHAAPQGWARSYCRRDEPRALDALQASYLKVLNGRASFDQRSRST